MHTKLAILLAGAFGASAFAQTHLHTPPTGTEREGPDATLIFGWAATQGHRFMDAAHTGPARAIKGVSFRLDDREHNAIGRTWSNVKVYVAHGDYSSIQYNKSPSYRLKDTPVLVFDQAWTFPALKGRPPLKPAAWGGVRNSLAFRFNKPWSYNGKDAIFLEFRFSGGKADNNVPWVGPTPKGFEYFLDSMPESMWRGGNGGNEYLTRSPKAGCTDSAFSSGKKLAAYFDAKVETTASAVKVSMFSYYTAPKAPVVYAFGLGGNRNGLDVGIGCEHFYVDLQSPLVLLIGVTDQKGYASATVGAPRATWMKDFWMQCAWFDSKTSQPLMTRAVRAPVGGGSGVVPAVTSYVASSDGKFSVWTAAAKGMPYIRYDL